MVTVSNTLLPQLDKNKKLLASWENQKKSDISLVKTIKPYGGRIPLILYNS